MKIVASIQVRMNSSRLKGKALKKICGKTSLEWVIESVKKSKYVDDFIVATTVDKTDDELVAFLEGIDVKYYRGDIENVGERLFKSAKELNADYVVRIVGDHPLNSYELLDFLIEKHLIQIILITLQLKTHSSDNLNYFLNKTNNSENPPYTPNHF